MRVRRPEGIARQVGSTARAFYKVFTTSLQEDPPRARLRTRPVDFFDNKAVQCSCEDLTLVIFIEFVILLLVIIVLKEIKKSIYVYIFSKLRETENIDY